ncbi:MAG TPA: hypothetical protein PLY64_12220, partial [Dokdonella sp.]|nr:hypothetical protein [Dokdonella sp.]
MSRPLRVKALQSLLPFALILLLPLGAFAQGKAEPAAKPAAGETAVATEAATNPKALIKTTLGDITIE